MEHAHEKSQEQFGNTPGIIFDLQETFPAAAHGLSARARSKANASLVSPLEFINIDLVGRGLRHDNGGKRSLPPEEERDV